MKFIEMIVPWLALLAGVGCLVACILWEEDKQWFWGLFVGNIVILGVACILPRGPALFLSQKYPTVEQSEAVGKVWSHLVRGTNAPPKSASSEVTPLPKKKGSWVWWKSFIILLPFTFLCWCFAFEEAIENMLKARKKNKKEGAQRAPEKGEHEESAKHHFLVPTAYDVLTMIIEGVRLVRGRK